MGRSFAWERNHAREPKRKSVENQPSCCAGQGCRAETRGLVKNKGDDFDRWIRRDDRIRHGPVAAPALFLRTGEPGMSHLCIVVDVYCNRSLVFEDVKGMMTARRVSMNQAPRPWPLLAWAKSSLNFLRAGVGWAYEASRFTRALCRLKAGPYRSMETGSRHGNTLNAPCPRNSGPPAA